MSISPRMTLTAPSSFSWGGSGSSSSSASDRGRSSGGKEAFHRLSNLQRYSVAVAKVGVQWIIKCLEIVAPTLTRGTTMSSRVVEKGWCQSNFCQ